MHQLEKNYVVLNKIPNDLDGILILGGPTNVGISKAHDQVNFNDAANWAPASPAPYMMTLFFLDFE